MAFCVSFVQSRVVDLPRFITRGNYVGIEIWKHRGAAALAVSIGVFMAAIAGPALAKTFICETDPKKSTRDMVPERFSWDDVTRVAVFTERYIAGDFKGTVIRAGRDGGRERFNLLFEVPEGKFGFSAMELLVSGPEYGTNRWYVMGVGYTGKGQERVLDGFLQDGLPRATCLSQSLDGSAGRP